MKRSLFFLIGLLLPAQAFAVRITDYGWNCNGFIRCGSPTDAVQIITSNIISGVTAFIGAMAIIAFIYGAILMITSRGEEGKEAGKKAMLYASLGLAFALVTQGVIQFVTGYMYILGA